MANRYHTLDCLLIDAGNSNITDHEIKNKELENAKMFGVFQLIIVILEQDWSYQYKSESHAEPT